MRHQGIVYPFSTPKASNTKTRVHKDAEALSTHCHATPMNACNAALSLLQSILALPKSRRGATHVTAETLNHRAPQVSGGGREQDACTLLGRCPKARQPDR